MHYPPTAPIRSDLSSGEEEEEDDVPTPHNDDHLLRILRDNPNQPNTAVWKKLQQKDRIRVRKGKNVCPDRLELPLYPGKGRLFVDGRPQPDTDSDAVPECRPPRQPAHKHKKQDTRRGRSPSPSSSGSSSPSSSPPPRGRSSRRQDPSSDDTNSSGGSDQSSSSSESESDRRGRRRDSRRRDSRKAKASSSRSRKHKASTSVRKLPSNSCDFVDDTTGKRNRNLLDRRSALYSLAGPISKIVKLCSAKSSNSRQQARDAKRRMEQIAKIAKGAWLEVYEQDEDLILSQHSDQDLISKLRGRDGAVILTGATKKKFESLKAEQRASQSHAAAASLPTVAPRAARPPPRVAAARPAFNRDQPATPAGRPAASNLKCHNCGVLGHVRINCPYPKRN